VEEDFYDPIEIRRQDEEGDWSNCHRMTHKVEVLTGRSLQVEAIGSDAIGDRNFDWDYDWNAHIGTTLTPDFLERAKQNRPSPALPPLSIGAEALL
jgi:hypothetical protein